MFHRRDPRIPALITLTRISSADLETSSVVQVRIQQEVPVEIWTDPSANKISFFINAQGSISESGFNEKRPELFRTQPDQCNVESVTPVTDFMELTCLLAG